MLAVVGLGNPGASYRNTRHNVGFMVLDGMAGGRFAGDAVYRKSGSDTAGGIFGAAARFRRTTGPYVMLEGKLSGTPFLLVKPTTYMNESGRAVASLVTRRVVNDAGELLVVVDDVDLELGCLRLRERGSAGGHNGLKSIIDVLGAGDFARLRIGTGPRPGGAEMVDYVLGSFLPEEREIVEEAIWHASRCIESWITGGIESALKMCTSIP